MRAPRTRQEREERSDANSHFVTRCRRTWHASFSSMSMLEASTLSKASIERVKSLHSELRINLSLPPPPQPRTPRRADRTRRGDDATPFLSVKVSPLLHSAPLSSRRASSQEKPAPAARKTPGFWACPECGARHPPMARECTECGYSYWRCGVCGVFNPDDIHECEECACTRHIATTVTTSAPPPPPPRPHTAPEFKPWLPSHRGTASFHRAVQHAANKVASGRREALARQRSGAAASRYAINIF